MDAAGATSPSCSMSRHCSHCRAPISDSASCTATVCHHLFCQGCSDSVFSKVSSATCPVAGCETVLQPSTVVVRDPSQRPEMLLVGHTHDAVAKAVSHALSQLQYSRDYAIHLSRKETEAAQIEGARAKARAQQLETELQAMSLTVAELSKQLETERRENTAAGRQRLGLQAQVNQRTRAKVSLEAKLHELESAAEKDDSEEDWGCSDGGTGLFAMMTNRAREQPSRQAQLLFTEQPP